MKLGNTGRKPTSWEQRMIRRLLAAEFPGRDEIAEQLRDPVVETIGSEVSFRFQNHSERLAPVEKRVPIEAEVKDEDGIPVYALLHVAKGKAVELEIYKADGSP